MCGRFSILSNSREIAEHFRIIDSGEDYICYNITPASNIPVVRNSGSNREIIRCHWGFIPSWARDDKFQPINAKAETLAEKPSFRSALKSRRCLIPANGFYEWKGEKGNKQPYYFRLPDDRLFAFAGLWEEWKHQDNRLHSCVIITTSANKIMRPVHGRMPVILNPENYDDWLVEGDTAVLQPYTDEMSGYPVSKRVNNPSNNDHSLLQAI